MRHGLKQPLPRQRSYSVESRFAINKHPVHPMLVVYPNAFLSVLLPTDLLYLWLRAPFWAEATFWLAAAGLGLGLLAATVGALDMFSIRVVRRHISAWNHLIAGVMLLALAAANVWLRWPDPEAAVYPWGVMLAGVTLVSVMIVGWLGGTLSFRHGIGVAGEVSGDEAGSEEAPPGQ